MMPTVPGPTSLFGLQFPSDPQLSPDGQRALYVLGRVEEDDPLKVEADWPKPRLRSRIVLADSSGARVLTTGQGRDFSPRWSPDARNVAFLSDRSGKPQLYVLPLGGGEARALTTAADFPQGVGGPQWSPDGQSLAFLAAEGEPI